MSGIYLHIPFCRQACNYCNFHFATSLHYKPEMISAMLNEIGIQRSFLQGGAVETIYFGGGTPSLLEMDELCHLLEKIRKEFTVDTDVEITLEANPDDITEEKLVNWKKAGINRMSIGIQSFFDEDLRWMNRAHTAQQAEQCLLLTKKYFSNITIDLIYGLPGLTDERWKSNVEKVLSYSIPHISCYALTVEIHTPLDKLIREKKVTNVDPEKQSQQFLLLMSWLEEAGYEHYEISNFALPGYRSRHNSAYWKGKPYLGIGPSAHSYNGALRQWNISNNQKYIQSINEGNIPAEKEILTHTQRANEYIMISLRTKEGIDLAKLDEEEQTRLLGTATKYIDSGMIEVNNNAFVLTKEGKLFADGIAADLFISEKDKT